MGRKNKSKKTTVPVKSANENDADRPPSGADSNVEGTSSAEPVIADESKSLRKELEETKDKLLRALAEQQNIQKRLATQKAEAVRYANVNAFTALLGIVDDFERTLEHTEGADSETLVKGVRLIYDNLLKLLNDNNVRVIDPAGEVFDPRCHEALLSQPSSDHEPGTVMQVVQRGYQLDDRILRPAKVIIAGEAPTSGDQQTAEAGAASKGSGKE